MTTPVLIELHAAAAPFLQPGTVLGRGRRERLRQALLAALAEHGIEAAPSALLGSPAEALDQLRAVIQRCEELHVPWSDVVAIVNREINEP